jgi:pimeloyl-ACP methyl ester carboxylesterase
MGQSAHVPSVAPSAWSDDVAALVRHLGVGQVHMYGVSLGARVALRTAIDTPSVIATLTLDMPIIANDEAGNSSLLDRFNANTDGLSQARKDELRALHGDDWANVFVNYSKIRSQKDVQDYLNLREPSKSVTAPTLIMRGDEPNEVHPLRHAVELHENIAGSWLWINPNSRGGQLETATEASIPVLKAFISQVAHRAPAHA